MIILLLCIVKISLVDKESYSTSLLECCDRTFLGIVFT